jgi:hypothetical protein
LSSRTKRIRQWTDRETISKKWAKELESDELKGQKKISVKIETHKALRGVAKTNESYDDIIGRLITFYKKYKYTVDNLNSEFPTDRLTSPDH